MKTSAEISKSLICPILTFYYPLEGRINGLDRVRIFCAVNSMHPCYLLSEYHNLELELYNKIISAGFVDLTDKIEVEIIQNIKFVQINEN